jgi:hypothetical protein
MKNKIFGIIALIAVIVFSMVACDTDVEDNGNQGNNPLIGVWIDWEGVLNLKLSANMEYSTAATNNFSIQGDYEISTTRGEVTIRPDNSNVQVWSYELQKSYLVLTSGTQTKWYTKNPETGGGFNGTRTGNVLVGMWENVNDANDCLAFNGDAEWFEAWCTEDFSLIQRNRDGRIWWHVGGEYQYNSSRNELTLRDHDGSNPRIYTVQQPRPNQIILTERDGTQTTFERRDNL